MRIEKRKKYPFVILAIVAFVAAIAVGFLVVGILNNTGEPNSVIVEAEPEENGTKAGVDVSLRYAGYINVLKNEKKITLNFTNPSTSKKSIRLELIANVDDEDIILGKSEIIRPGQKIIELKYDDNHNIPQGKYEGKYIIFFYNDRDEEEIVKSEIAINVFVK